MKVIGYCRVSTVEQANSGLGLEAQRAAITRWAAERGAELVIHEDAGITGTSMEGRPALEAALAEARSGAVLVAYSLSRFARSTRDMLLIAERLKGQGADLVSLTESIDTTTATGRLVFTLLSALSQFERDLTSERTKSALAALKARGVQLGRPVEPGSRRSRLKRARTCATKSTLPVASSSAPTWPEGARCETHLR